MTDNIFSGDYPTSEKFGGDRIAHDREVLVNMI